MNTNVFVNVTLKKKANCTYPYIYIDTHTHICMYVCMYVYNSIFGSVL
jgi:hypothetical protein